MAIIVHLIKDVVKTVVNVVGDVVKGDFGHIDNDLAHGFEDVGKHIYTDVIKPIADDPLRFIATVAPYFIPGVGPIAGSVLSGVMNAGVGLAEGEKFGDALKSGVIAGATGYAGGALAGKAFGSTVGKSMTASEKALWGNVGEVGAPAGVTNPLANSLYGDLGSTINPKTGTFIKNLEIGAPAASDLGAAFDTSAAAFKNAGMDVGAEVGRNSRTASLSADPSLSLPSVATIESVPVTNVARSANTAASEAANAEGAANPPMTVKEMMSMTQETPASIVERSYGADGASAIGDISSATTKGSAGEAGASSGNMLWDGAKWVMDNKIMTGLGILALDKLGAFGESGGTGGAPSGAPDLSRYNATFDQPLDQYAMSQSRNQYGDDLNKYAESGGGEFKFLSDPVYTPVPAAARGGYVKMADGGPVNQDPYNNDPYAAQPMPMPQLQGQGLQAMQGYADGGSVNPTDRERMMLQQQQLRSAFGGNPTEAERRIYAQQLQQMQQQRNRSPLTGMQQQQLRSAFGGNPTEGERRMMQGAGAGIQGYADGGSVVEYADPNVQQMPVAQGYQGSMPWGSSGTLPQGGPMSEADRQQMLQQLAPLTALSMKGAPPRPGTPQQGQQGQPVRPGAPQQGQPGTLSQMVAPSKQNPNYKYYGYGTVPQSVAPSQAAGTLGGTMTQQERIRQQQRLHQQMLMQQQQGRHAKGGKIADGRSDDVPAMLSNGEYVMDAESVGLLGNGSSDAGAKKLDAMRAAIRKQKGQALAKGKISPNAKAPSKYLK